MSTENQKPVEKIRVGGVQIAIWKRDHEGKSFYTASVELSYKDGDEYKKSGSYGLRDLLNLAKAALMAHSAIGKLIREDKNAEQADEDHGE